jgi:hypothetical protein
MYRLVRRSWVLLGSALAALTISAAATAATVTPVMTGLDNPRGLAFGPEGGLYVVEAGRGGSGPPCRIQRGITQCYGATGAISRLWHGVQEKWITGLPSMAAPSGAEAESGPQHISFQGRGGAYVTVGLGTSPARREPLLPELALSGHLLKVTPSGKIKTIADLASYEGAANPDGSLIDSNPFGVLAQPARQLAVDAAANAILEVAADGEVSTLAVLNARANPTPIGPPSVEAVPTAVEQGPDGALYVSELTGVPFLTGFARVHRIAPDGTTSVYATGLTAVIDLAFGEDGALYALQHASCGPFFACPGSIVRVAALAPHPVVFGGLSRATAFTIGPDGAFYVSNRGTSAGIGEVLRIEP